MFLVIILVTSWRSSLMRPRLPAGPDMPAADADVDVAEVDADGAADGSVGAVRESLYTREVFDMKESR